MLACSGSIKHTARSADVCTWLMQACFFFSCLCYKIPSGEKNEGVFSAPRPKTLEQQNTQRGSVGKGIKDMFLYRGLYNLYNFSLIWFSLTKNIYIQISWYLRVSIWKSAVSLRESLWHHYTCKPVTWSTSRSSLNPTCVCVSGVWVFVFAGAVAVFHHTHSLYHRMDLRPCWISIRSRTLNQMSRHLPGY